MVRIFSPKIYEIRGEQVMIDSDLSIAYGIELRVLNQAAKRNIQKFPPEFMFQLTQLEYDSLISQIVISNDKLNEKSNKSEECLRSQFVISNDGLNLKPQIMSPKPGRGGRRYLPHVFTEHGVVMLASVLNSPKAIEMNIAIVKSFIAMRNYIAAPIKVSEKIENLEKVLMLHIDDTNHNLAAHTVSINEIVEILNRMIETPPKPRRKIGFRINDDED